MKTPEKSIEEIMRECDVLFEGIELAKGWFRKTLQAERQKRDELVEAERKRTRLAESYIIGEYIDEYYTKAEALTQPNNPK